MEFFLDNFPAKKQGKEKKKNTFKRINKKLEADFFFFPKQRKKTQKHFKKKHSDFLSMSHMDLNKIFKKKKRCV